MTSASGVQLMQSIGSSDWDGEEKDMSIRRGRDGHRADFEHSTEEPNQQKTIACAGYETFSRMETQIYAQKLCSV